MVHRRWLVDFNEEDQDGVPLIAHLYGKSRINNSTDQDQDLKFVGSLENIWDLRGRFKDDFAPLCATFISLGADPWKTWEEHHDDFNQYTQGISGGGHGSLIHYCILKNDLMFLKFLLSQPNRPDISKWRFTQKDSRPKDADNFPKMRQDDDIGKPLMHIAANQISDESVLIVKELVKAGLDPNIRDGEGRTPLFYARSVEMVKQLMKVGADPFILDDNEVSLSKYWEGHLGNTKAASDFYALVLTIASEKISPEEIRRSQASELFKSLSSGNKTTTTSLFRKAKFSYDYKIKYDQSGFTWNLVTPVLLRTDIDKAMPIVSWLSSKVPWEEDLGEGVTNLGISMFVPGFSSFTLHKGVQKDRLTPQNLAPQMISSITEVLSNHWAPLSVEMKMIGSYFSWCLLPQLREDISNREKMTPHPPSLSSVKTRLLSSLPEVARGEGALGLVRDLSREMIQPEALTKIGLVGISCLSRALEERSKNIGVYFGNFVELSLLLSHCHRQWKNGDASYALPCALLGVLSLGTYSSTTNTPKWLPGGGTPEEERVDYTKRCDLIMEDISDLLESSKVDRDKLSQLSNFLDDLPEKGKVKDVKVAIRRHMLMFIVDHKGPSGPSAPRM